MGEWVDGILQWKYEPAMSETELIREARECENPFPKNLHKCH